MPRPFEGVGPDEQLVAWEGRALDARPPIATGWESIDELLYRGGLQPGTFVLLGGRTHTRKTTVALNLIVNLLKADVPVGLLSLDEPLPAYVAKLASIVSRHPHGWLEEQWHDPVALEAREMYRNLIQPEGEPGRLMMTRGSRPDLEKMSGWLDMADANGCRRPRVVFIDYMQRVGRSKFAGKNVESIPQLAEDLADWTNDQELVTIALHQVSRQQNLNHGDKPLVLENLKYGGEEPADVVLATYRPELDELGKMTHDDAELLLGDDFNDDKYDAARARVERYRQSTMLQLLKNRPGTHLDFHGVELLSPDDTLYMEPATEQGGRL